MAMQRDIPRQESAFEDHIALLGLARGGSKAFKALNESSLLENAQWPAPVRNRIQRYMHSRDLYHVDDVEDEVFSNLTSLFIAAAGLPKTTVTRDHVADECKSFINSTAEAWRHGGVLVGSRPEHYKKHPDFLSVWEKAVSAGQHTIEKSPSNESEDILTMSRHNSTSRSISLSSDYPFEKRNADDVGHSRSSPSLKRAKRNDRNSAQDDTEHSIVVIPHETRQKKKKLARSTEADVQWERARSISNGDEVIVSPQQHVSNAYNNELERSSEHITDNQDEEWSARLISPSLHDSHRYQKDESPGRKEIDLTAPSSRSASWSIPDHDDDAIDVVRVPTSPQSSLRRVKSEIPARGRVAGSQNVSGIILPSSTSPNGESATSPKIISSSKEEFYQFFKTSRKNQAQPPRTAEHWADLPMVGAVGNGPSDITVIDRNNRSIVESVEGSEEAGNATTDMMPSPTILVMKVEQNPDPIVIEDVPSRDASSQPSAIRIDDDLTKSTSQTENHSHISHSHSDESISLKTPNPLAQPFHIPRGDEENFRSQNFRPDVRQESHSSRPRSPTTHESASNPSQIELALPSDNDQQGYQPPPILFTLDNCTKSPLTRAEMKPYMDAFLMHSRVVLPPYTPQSELYPVGVIMWQSLPEFYTWYEEVARVPNVGALSFEMMDVFWRTQNLCILQTGQEEAFRVLKQYIWGFFWMVSHRKENMKLFRVAISPYKSPATQELQPSASRKNSQNLKNEPVKSKPDSNHDVEVKAHMEPRELSLKLQPAGGQSPAPLNQAAGPMQSHIVYQVPSLEADANPKRAPSFSYPTPSPQSREHSINCQQIQSRRPSYPDSHSVTPQAFTGTLPLAMDSTTNSMKHRERNPINITRSVWDKNMLLEQTQRIVADRSDLQIDPEESTSQDMYRSMPGWEIRGAVIDKKSGKGFVSVSWLGYAPLKITTGLDVTGERYQHVKVQKKESFEIHGGAVLLCYRSRIPGFTGTGPYPSYQTPSEPRPDPQTHPKLQPPPYTRPQTEHQSQSHSPTRVLVPSPPILQSISSTASKLPEILIRLQTSPTNFSAPYPKTILHPRVTTTEFFSFFVSSTNSSPRSPHSIPAPRPSQFIPSNNSSLPPVLKFTFKDAMPTPRATEIALGNEDHFRYMRKDIKEMCEKAGNWLAGMREFVILVSVPGHENVSAMDEDDEW